MDGYFIHLDGSTLKVGLYNGAQNPKFLKEDLLPTALSHSKVIDPQEFCKELGRILAAHYGEELPKLPLIFILEPEVTELFLLTGSKNDNGEKNESEFMEKQIQKRLVNEKPEDFYCGQYKIAPFIYQFVGIKKAILNPLLDVATIMGLELSAILPLGLVLAKTNTDISSMFVFPNKDGNTVVFSELTGVTFAEKLEGKLSLKELKELFWKLSVYNPKQSEVRIYTFSKFEQVLGSDNVMVLGDETLENGFEEIDLTQRVVQTSQSLVSSQSNLLNIVPVPEIATKSKAPLIVGVSITSFLLVVGLIFQLTVGFNTLFGKQPQSVGQKQEVLAKQEQTQSVTPAPAQQETPPAVEQKKDLKRTDLRLRVENGNGVAGSAGKLRSYLEGFGYTVVSIGNADKTSYAKTTIRLPKELADYKDLLTNDLKTNYSVEITDVDSKPEDYDVLIIVGAE